MNRLKRAEGVVDVLESHLASHLMALDLECIPTAEARRMLGAIEAARATARRERERHYTMVAATGWRPVGERTTPRQWLRHPLLAMRAEWTWRLIRRRRAKERRELQASVSAMRAQVRLPQIAVRAQDWKRDAELSRRHRELECA